MNNWRLVIDQPKSGWENMAADEAILSGCNQGLSKPTLRLYEWSIPTLSIGCFQKADTIIQCCAETGIPLVRRITGGRAVLHADEITYSIICGENERLFGEGILGAYQLISKCLLEALRAVGVNADMHTFRAKHCDFPKNSCFHSPSKYEIIVNNRKLVGSAQRRFNKALLQHGSILFGIERELVLGLFGEESLSRMAWLGLYGGVKKDEFRAAFIDKIQEGLNISLTPEGMTDDEIYLKDKLIMRRYKNNIWNRENRSMGLQDLAM